MLLWSNPVVLIVATLLALLPKARPTTFVAFGTVSMTYFDT